MIYVKRIISTLQGGCDQELGPKTLLCGRNAAGKSRIRRSVELAVTGSASDVAGRDEVSRGIDLLGLATAGQNLKAQALLSDGTECRYELQRVTSGKGKSLKVTSSAVEPIRPPSVDPETVLPLRRLYESILGKPETARKFFLSHTVREIVRSDVLSRLPEQLKTLYEKAVNESGIQSMQPEINKLLAALEIAAAHAGTATREANAAKKTANESGQGLAAPPTEADYTAAKASVEAARAALEAAVAAYQQSSHASDLTARLEHLQGQLAAAEQRHVQAQANLAAIEAEVAKLPTVEAAKAHVQPMDPLLKTTIDALLAHAAAGPGMCGVCGTETQPGTWRARAPMAKAELERHEKATADATAYLNWAIQQHARADELLGLARFEVEQAAQSIELGKSAVAQVQGLLASVPSNGAVSAPLTIENARSAMQAAEAQLRALDSAKAAWESTKKMRDGAVAAESESNRWHQLADACNEIVRDLLDAGVAAFNARVQLYLPPTDRFSLRLRDGGREVCQFGLMRGEQLYTALSGAEWARTTAALAAVCGPTSEDRLAVVCPEERAFDPDTLTDVLRALSGIPQQVILESPIRPTTVPQGWRLVEVGESVAAAAPKKVAAAAPAAPPEAPPAPAPPRAPPLTQ